MTACGTFVLLGTACVLASLSLASVTAVESLRPKNSPLPCQQMSTSTFLVRKLLAVTFNEALTPSIDEFPLIFSCLKVDVSDSGRWPCADGPWALFSCAATMSWHLTGKLSLANSCYGNVAK